MNAIYERLSGLTVSELRVVAKRLNVKLGDYARQSKEQLVGKIAANAAPDAIEAVLSGGPIADAEIIRQSDAPEAMHQLQSALLALVGGSVNEDKVREIVAEAVQELKPTERFIIVRDGVQAALPDGEYMRPEFQPVLDLAAQGMNIMLVGPAGSGKTYFAAQVAKALGRPFSANSCSAGMSESQLSGWLLPVADAGKFVFVASSFVNAYENGGVHLIDEIDAADPNTLVFVNQALANGHFFLPQRHENPEVKRHPDFVCIAAANTFGTGGDRMYVGREQLDAATLDRFWMIEIGYDETLEDRLCDETVVAWGRELRAKVAALRLRRVVSTRKLIEASKMKAAGWSMKQVKAQFFAPWSTDERAKVAA
jgi:cobaltochelatase CobS